jgi:hypothetical protein
MTDQVTPPADQDTNPNPDSLGWRAGLSDEHKDHDWAKSYTKVSDFYRDALEVKTKHDDLQSKLDGAIFKPSENATDEQIAAYRKAMGVPDNPTDYEFPKGENIEHDPKMIEFAQKLFHEAGLSAEQAKQVSTAWDAHIQAIAKSLEEQENQALKDVEATQKEKWGDEYDKNFELSKRAFAKFAGKDLAEFKVHPVLVDAFYEVGKAMGEDETPHGGKGGQGKEPQVGMKYDMPDFGGN